MERLGNTRVCLKSVVNSFQDCNFTTTKFGPKIARQFFIFIVRLLEIDRNKMVRLVILFRSISSTLTMKMKNRLAIFVPFLPYFVVVNWLTNQNLKIEIKKFPLRFFGQSKFIRKWLVMPVVIK